MPVQKRAEEILKKVRRIELSTRQIIDSMLSGQYHTHFKGQGMQFSDLREYYVGDDIRHIDWKVTARTQQAHIKKFEEERELNVYFIVDVSGSEEFGSHEKSKLDILAEVCGLLSFAAVRNGDKIGLILTTDQIERHVPPRKGQGHALRIVSELLMCEPKSKRTHLGTALDYCFQVMKHKGVVFIASDFFDNDYDMALKRLARRHDVIAIRVRDRRESELPALGILEVCDAETGEPYWFDTKNYNYRKSFTQRTEQFEQNLSSKFIQSNIDTLEIWTHENYLIRVVDFFKSRKRRLG